jgi:hypothetical protein
MSTTHDYEKGNIMVGRIYLMSAQQIGPTSAHELPGQLRKSQSKRDAMSAFNQTMFQLVHERPSPLFMRCHVIILVLCQHVMCQFI